MAPDDTPGSPRYRHRASLARFVDEARNHAAGDRQCGGWCDCIAEIDLGGGDPNGRYALLISRARATDSSMIHRIRTLEACRIPISQRVALTIATLALAALFQGCAEDVRSFEGERLTVGCAKCIFEMENAVNCPWAAEIDGEHHLIEGALPKGHNSHAADGMCSIRREAIVSGELRNGTLVVSSMELQPARDIPSHPVPPHTSER